MFYMALLDDYHGLSNRAFEIRASYNTSLSKKSYTRLKDVTLEEYNRKTTDAIRQGLAVGICDNYNQQYFLSQVISKRHPLQNRNRCGVAVSLLGPNYRAPAQVNPNLESIPEPDELLPFLTVALRKVEDALESIISPNTLATDWKFYDNAEVTQGGMYCVPLKLPEEKAQERNFPPHDIGLTYFRPQKILCADPASKRGCYKTFQELYKIFQPAFEENQYIPFRMDRNIYDFFLRVSLPL
jgi:hypothetical protein